MKRILSFLLALALIAAAIPALADDTQEPGLSPSVSVTLTNLNQVTGTVITPGQSPTMSMTLNNLNQVTGTSITQGQSPTMSMTLNNLNQVTGTNTAPGQSPTLSMTLKNLNQVTGTSTNPVLSPTLSMTLNTLNQFSATVEGYGISLNGLFTIRDTLSEDARAAFDAIVAYVGKGQSVIGYFGTDISKLITSGTLSQNYLGFDFSKLILSEYISLGINSTLENGVNVTSTFGFASQYQDGQTVVTMFGYRNQNGDIVWHALNTVTVNGQLRVNIPSELLRLAGSEAILGILS